MELRQLRYFVTLAEELHFGRAAAREHIVPSALSQQIQRLERELKVALVERTTHHVTLTAAGAVLLPEARRILHAVEHAAAAARTATPGYVSVRVALGDASFDAMPLVTAAVRDHHPTLATIHHVEAGVPEQYRLLLDGRLDVGIGRAAHAPDGVASELIRHDRLGVLMGTDHPLAHQAHIPVAQLAGQQMLFVDDTRAPELNQFVREMCRAAGLMPITYPGTVQSVMGARMLLHGRRALLCIPKSGAAVAATDRALVLLSVVAVVARGRGHPGGAGDPLLRKAARASTGLDEPRR